MNAEFVCLTLIAGGSLREKLLDYLSEQRDLVSDFTTFIVEGHGPDVRLQTAAERVKGYADQLMVRTVLQAHDATQLLERLNTAFVGSRIVYSIMPVTEFGVIGGPVR